MRQKLPPRLDVFVQTDVEPAHCYATQRFLLQAVAQGRRPPTLHVYTFRDDHASLGRFHIAPPDRGTDLHRRHAGGRVLPLGPGYVGIALVLPRRDALIEGAGGTPEVLSAAQVMNRHVRGFLRACRTAGVDPIYPGRDVVTVGRRIVASVALETREDGAAVFEMIVAVWRAFDDTPSLIDRADPDGVVTAAFLTADEVTDLERELERSIGFEDLIGVLRHGFGQQLGAEVVPVELDAVDAAAIETLAVEGAAEWVYGRCRSPNLTHRGSQIGGSVALDVYFEERDGLLGQVVVSGDFIANSPGVLRMEAALRGCRRDAGAIDSALAAACMRPGEFLLGLGKEPAAAIREAILRGEPW